MKRLFWILAIVLVSSFYLLTMRSGHDWSDDFARYIQHAKNIVSNRPYEEMNYIFNTQYQIVGPKSYPPLYPTVLAIGMKLGIQSINQLKLVNIPFLIWILIVLVLIGNKRLKPHYQIWWFMAVAINPVIWEQKDRILTDLLFLALVLTLWWSASSKNRLLIWLLIPALIWTRSVGLVFGLAIAFYDFVSGKRRYGFSLLLFTFISYFIGRMLAPGSDYGVLLKEFKIQDLLFNLRYYLRDWSVWWDSGYSFKARKIITIIASLIIAVSIWKRRKRIETYLITFYLVSILPWPSFFFQGIRYLLPIIPIALFLLAEELQNYKGKYFKYLMTVTLVCYALAYTKVTWQEISPGIESKNTKELFNWISKTGTDDVFIFSRPRTIALLTNRTTTSADCSSVDGFYDWVGKVKADYLIRWLITDRGCLPEVLENKENWNEKFRNEEFVVYELRRR